MYSSKGWILQHYVLYLDVVFGEEQWDGIDFIGSEISIDWFIVVIPVNF
jgi:hypothetical protein